MGNIILCELILRYFLCNLLVKAERYWDVEHVPPAVLSVHLAAVVVQLPVGAAGESRDPPASGITVLSGLAVTSRNRDHALAGGICIKRH